MFRMFESYVAFRVTSTTRRRIGRLKWLIWCNDVRLNATLRCNGWRRRQYRRHAGRTVDPAGAPAHRDRTCRRPLLRRDRPQARAPGLDHQPGSVTQRRARRVPVPAGAPGHGRAGTAGHRTGTPPRGSTPARHGEGRDHRAGGRVGDAEDDGACARRPPAVRRRHAYCGRVGPQTEGQPCLRLRAVGFLVQHGYVRRERDPQRRRDVCVVDDEARYHSITVSARQTLESARAAMAAAEVLGSDSPVGQRLLRAGAFLERVVEGMRESADRWRALLARER